MFADTIIKSNAVFTGLQDEPFAGGVAVADGKILAACTDEELKEYQDEDPALVKRKKLRRSIRIRFQSRPRHLL